MDLRITYRIKRLLIHAELYSYLFFSVIYVAQSCFLALVPRCFRRRSVHGQVALVTGGAMGIGRLTAMKLAAKGAKVIIWDVNAEACAETEEEIRSKGGTCFSYVLDISDPNMVKETAKSINEEHGMVNILVNNAGIAQEYDLLIDDEDLIEKHFKVNTLSHFWTVKSFLPDMKKANDGHIVTISSIAGKFGCPKMVAYSATKFAICGFDESLRFQLDAEGFHNITTTLVCPFFINTRMGRGIKTRLHPNLSADYASDEIVDAILLKTRRLILPPVMRIMVALKGLTHNKVETLISEASIGKNPIENAEWNIKRKDQEKCK